MPTIEQRVVEMRFDNDQFERGVGKSLGTLDKLNKSLELDGASKGLTNIQNQAKKFNLSGMDVAINSITQKFSALEIAGITAIQNLTTRGMNMMTNFVKSVTIDQLAAGWSKYADKTSSVQTIMAATAKDFEKGGDQMGYVNSQLDKLNWFTDETSYNFLEMVNNIGKFTSNGIKLDKAVTSMQGIATWAAISGANAGEASRAMYNLSQAIATGTVQLIDWKSIENANMATREFKEMVLEAAAAQGTLKKASDGTYKTLKGSEVSVAKFNATLSEKWFTDKVLLSTLNKYGSFTDQLYTLINKADLDGATSALELLDDYAKGQANIKKISEDTGTSVEELEGLLKKLNSTEMALGKRAFKAAQEAKTFKEAIDATADAVSTGWMKTFELMFGNYDEARKLWTGFANGLYDVFAAGGERRNELLEEWHNAELGGYKDMVSGLSALWAGINNLLSPLKNAWEAIFPYLSSNQLTTATANFKKFAEEFKEITGTFDEVFTESGFVESTTLNQIAHVFSVIDDRVDQTKARFSSLREAINKLGDGSVTREYWETLANSIEIPEHLKTAFLDAAVAYGTLRKTEDGYETSAKKTSVTVDNLAESLDEGWAAADVLREALLNGEKAVKKSSKQLQNFEGDTKKYTDTATKATKAEIAAKKARVDNMMELRGVKKMLDETGGAMQTLADVSSGSKWDGLSKIEHVNWNASQYKKMGSIIQKNTDYVSKYTDTATKGSRVVAASINPMVQELIKAQKETRQFEKDTSRATDTATSSWQTVRQKNAKALQAMVGEIKKYTDTSTAYSEKKSSARIWGKYTLDNVNQMGKMGSVIQKNTGQLSKYTDTGTGAVKTLTAFQKVVKLVNHTIVTYSKLNESIEPFKAFTKEERIDRLKDILTALFFTIETGKNIIKSAFSAVKEVGNFLFGKLVPVFDMILDKVANASRHVSDFMYNLQVNGSIVKFFDNIRDSLIKIIDYAFELGHRLRISAGVAKLTESLKNLIARLTELKDKVLGKLKKDIGGFDLAGIAKMIGDNFVKYLSVAAGTLGEFIDLVIDGVDWLVELYNQFVQSDAFKAFEKGITRVYTAFSNIGDYWEKSESFSEFLKTFYIHLVGAGTHAHVIAPIIDRLKKTFQAFFYVIGELLSEIPGFEELNTAVHAFFDAFQAPEATIGDALQAAFDVYGININETIEGIKTKISEIKEKIKTFVNAAIETIPPEERTVGKVVLVVVKKIFEFLATAISNFAQKIPSMAESAADAGGGIIRGILDGIMKVVSNQLNNPESFFRNVTQGIWDFWDFFLDKMLAWDPQKAENLMKKGGLAGLLTLLFNFVKSVSSAMNGIGNIPKNIAGVFKSMSGTLKAYSNDLNAEALWKVAKAIGVLALSLIGLSFLSQEDLSRVTASLLMVGGIIIAVMAIIAKMKGTSKDDDATIGQKLMKPFAGFIDGVKETIGKYAKIAGIGVMIFKIAKAIKVISKVVNMFKSMSIGELIKGFGGLLVAAEILVLVTKQLSKIKFKNDNIAKDVMKLSVSLYIMAAAMKKIGKMDFLDALQGIAGIGAVMFLMTVFARSMEQLDLTKVGGGILLMALAMNMLIIPITVLGLLPFWTVVQGLFAIVGALTALTVAAIAINQFGAEDALMSLAIAMVAITFPLMALGSMAKESAIGLLIFLGALAGMLVAAYLAQGMSMALTQLSLTFVVLSLAAMGFGVAAYFIAKAIKTLVETFPLIVAGVIALGDAIKNHAAEFAIGIAAIIGAIAAGILAAKGTLASSIVSVVITIAQTLTSNLPILLGTIGMGLLMLLLFLRKMAPGLVEGLVKLIISVITSLAQSIRDNTKPILDAVASIIDAVLDLLIEAFASFVDAAGFHGTADKIRGLKDKWNPAAKDLAESTSDALTDNIDVSDAGNVIEDEMASELESLNVEESSTAAGEHIAGNIVDGMGTGVNDYLANWDVPDSMKNSLSDMFGGTIDTSIQGGNDNAEGWGTGWEDYFTNFGTDNMTTSVTEAVTTAGDAGAEKASSKGETSGGNYVSGIDKGIRDGERTLYNAGWFAAETLDNGYKDKSETKSPSRVARRDGKFWDQGLALGVIENSGIVKNAGEKSANTLIDTLRNIAGTISSVLSDDMDFNPTITPVLDLSNIQNGTNAINGMFGNTSFALASANGSAFEANRLAALNKLETTSTNADVVAALGLLRGDVNNLNDSFLGTQVVLDSGALVGATARQMDNALGRIKVYKGRGI